MRLLLPCHSQPCQVLCCMSKPVGSSRLLPPLAEVDVDQRVLELGVHLACRHLHSHTGQPNGRVGEPHPLVRAGSEAIDATDMGTVDGPLSAQEPKRTKRALNGDAELPQIQTSQEAPKLPSTTLLESRPFPSTSSRHARRAFLRVKCCWKAAMNVSCTLWLRNSFTTTTCVRTSLMCRTTARKLGTARQRGKQGHEPVSKWTERSQD